MSDARLRRVQKEIRGQSVFAVVTRGRPNGVEK